MSFTTIMKKGFRGFTLIELLVVIAIIGLLSTIIAAPIQTARKKAKDAKKVAELDALRLALEQYADGNGANYPTHLSQLAPTYIPVLPSWYNNASVRDKMFYVVYSGKPSNTATVQNFGYHMGLHLDVYGPSLDGDRDCAGATSGNTLTAYVSGTLAACVFYPADSAGIAVTPDSDLSGLGFTAQTAFSSNVAGTDYIGADPNTGTDIGTSTCSAVTDCVYDMTGQQ